MHASQRFIVDLLLGCRIGGAGRSGRRGAGRGADGNGLVVLRDSEAFAGTVTKPIHYQHVMVMRYVDGKAQGIWERRTADGVVVQNISTTMELG